MEDGGRIHSAVSFIGGCRIAMCGFTEPAQGALVIIAATAADQAACASACLHSAGPFGVHSLQLHLIACRYHRCTIYGLLNEPATGQLNTGHTGTVPQWKLGVTHVR
jgi:hypothetical protein